MSGVNLNYKGRNDVPAVENGREVMNSPVKLERWCQINENVMGNVNKTTARVR